MDTDLVMAVFTVMLIVGICFGYCLAMWIVDQRKIERQWENRLLQGDKLVDEE